MEKSKYFNISTEKQEMSMVLIIILIQNLGSPLAVLLNGSKNLIRTLRKQEVLIIHYASSHITEDNLSDF